MKIPLYWVARTIPEDGSEIHFKAGGNTPAEAEAELERKIAIYRRCMAGDFSAKPKETDDYAQPICEEVCDTIDEHNLVTRNRYGALVLNSEELLFLDVDLVSHTFGELVRSIFGLAVPDDKTRLLNRIERLRQKPPYQDLAVRVYETKAGFRLLLAKPGLQTLNSPGMDRIFCDFDADLLYAELCRKQQCFRARLTPKPARIKMTTARKFRFPYAEADKEAMAAWLAEYEKKSADYAVCRLIAQIGKKFTSPAIEYHDRMTKADRHLPLA